MFQENGSNKLIAITGSTASGKTTFARLLKKKLGDHQTVIICQDDYYKNRAHLNRKERKKINFDDIEAFDCELLTKHLIFLKNGKSVLSPVYDFIQSRRLERTKRVVPKQFIIVEGLMPFFDKKQRILFDYKIYIDVNNSVCLARRIRRDTRTRGDSIEIICNRYFKDVLPMQKLYVEPQKRWADAIVDGSDCCHPKVINKIKNICLKNTRIK